MCLPALPSAYAASSPKRLLGQLEIDEQFSKALDLVGNGHFVFGAENKYLLALRDVLKEAVNDQYDYIDWWLYEATDDYTVWEADCTMKYGLLDGRKQFWMYFSKTPIPAMYYHRINRMKPSRSFMRVQYCKKTYERLVANTPPQISNQLRKCYSTIRLHDLDKKE